MFKISVSKRPKYETENNKIKCTVYFDVTNLVSYIMEGPNGLFKYDKETGKKTFTPAEINCHYGERNENQELHLFAKAVAVTISNKLTKKGILKFHGDDCYVTGVAKFNSEDPKEQYDKQAGRRIAYAKAQLELQEISMAILTEMNEMGDRLKDCVSWMMTQHPNNIPNRVDNAKASVERAVALACKEDKSEDTNA